MHAWFFQWLSIVVLRTDSFLSSLVCWCCAIKTAFTCKASFLWLPQKFANLPPGLDPGHSEAIINKDDPNQQGARQAAQSALPVADDSDDRNWRTRAPQPPAADGAAPPERELIRGPPAANGAPERPSPAGPRPSTPQQVGHRYAVMLVENDFYP